jgi:DNA-binding NtrC family response regulator
MERKGNILVVDDDKDILLTARIVLKKQFELIRTTDKPEDIPGILQDTSVDVVLLDMNFSSGTTSGREGIIWLRKLHELDDSINVIMITAYGEINLAVKAMKEGAVDFIVKPWDNKKLLATVMAAYRLGQSRKEIETLKSTQRVLTRDIEQPFSEIIGFSQVMQDVFKTVEKVSTTDANILLLGENGTGKELVARLIHRKSNRADKIFIGVDLGALSDTLFESELFGHVKGAFTDAKEDRAGRFELASGGTLFLDEIGNLSLQLQVKLLAAIQNKEITRVGATLPKKTDVRLISATNMPLHEMIDQNKFRQDLLYRINTVEIRIPPLRERSKDIPLLINHFLNIHSRKYNKPVLKISKSDVKELINYNWPGNVRELQHLVERAVIMSEGPETRLADFIIEAGRPKFKPEDILNLEDMEKITIENAIARYRGNISKAAKELGLGRTTLYRKINKYGI